MKTMINNEINFDFGRYVQLIKTDMRLNGKSYLRNTLAIIGGFVAISAFVSMLAANNLTSIKEEYLNLFGSLEGLSQTSDYKLTIEKYSVVYGFGALFLASLALTVIGSLTFNTLSDKRSRISYLMIPANPFEKYLSKFTIYTLGGSAVIILGWLIGYLIVYISFGANGIVNHLFEDVADQKADSILHMLTASVILYMFVGNALYALGSALWPRLSWLKTWLVLTVIQWVGSIVIATGIVNFYNAGITLGKWVCSDSFLTWCVCIMISLIALLWGLAWIRFRNTQIIQRFMTK